MRGPARGRFVGVRRHGPIQHCQREGVSEALTGRCDCTASTPTRLGVATDWAVSKHSRALESRYRRYAEAGRSSQTSAPDSVVKTCKFAPRSTATVSPNVPVTSSRHTMATHRDGNSFAATLRI